MVRQWADVRLKLMRDASECSHTGLCHVILTELRWRSQEVTLQIPYPNNLVRIVYCSLLCKRMTYALRFR